MMGAVRPTTLLLPALLGLVVACGGEDPVVDDGTQGIPLAGLAPQLEEAGVEVIAVQQPAAATGDDVAAALEAVRLSSDEVDDLGLDDPVAGLVTVEGDARDYVVLVFDGPSTAAVFAAADLPVLAADAATYLAGNLVGVAVGRQALVRRALRGLAESP